MGLYKLWKITNKPRRKSHGGYTSDGDIEEDEPEPSSEWSWGWGGFPSKEKTEKSGKGSEADAENADALNDLSGYCELSLCGPAAFKDGEVGLQAYVGFC